MEASVAATISPAMAGSSKVADESSAGLIFTGWRANSDLAPDIGGLFIEF
jgi:hypothetical protein